MVRTYGLTHVALTVRDLDRAARFYQQVFGAIEVYCESGFMQLQTPGSRDVLVLEAVHTGRAGQAGQAGRAGQAGTSGGIAHFGFRLVSPKDIGAAARAVRDAGGTVTSQGEFVPGEPYLFARDPDGYEIEIWYELPTPVDPPRGGARISKTPRVRKAGRA